MIKKNDLIKVSLPCEAHEHTPRECVMSVSLYENARQTVGELRDFLRFSGLSWDFFQQQIDLANRQKSPLEKALKSMDAYSTGIGKALDGLPHNVW